MIYGGIVAGNQAGSKAGRVYAPDGRRDAYLRQLRLLNSAIRREKRRRGSPKRQVDISTGALQLHALSPVVIEGRSSEPEHLRRGQAGFPAAVRGRLPVL